MGKISAIIIAAVAACALSAKPLEFDKLSLEMKNDIHAEWMIQAGVKPNYPAICADEIERTKRVFARSKVRDIDAKLLADFEKMPDGYVKYIKLRKLKRDVMFANLPFDKIIAVDSPFPVGMENSHESRVKTENTAAFDAALLCFDLGNPFHMPKYLTSGADKAITRASLDYDASKIVFSMRAKSDPTYNLYTMNADGSNLKKITASDYNDCDPAWLPDGNIVFATTRSNHYIRCAGSGFRGTTLATCKPDGSDIYFISTNNEADFMPSVLDDGRVIYCRWEYVDKNIFRLQSLWTVNPDGSNPQVYWGGQSHWPDLKIGAYQIPDTDDVMMMTAGHHNVFNAGVAIVNPKNGTNFPNGIKNLTPHLKWTEASYYDANAPTLPYNEKFSLPNTFNSFYSPFPIDKYNYLVSARKQPARQWTVNGESFALYLADIDGNIELIAHGKYNLFYGQPIMKRKTPRIIPSSIEKLGDKKGNEEAPKGYLYSANVYENSGIPFGAGKWLRVVEHCAPTYQDGLRDSAKQWKAVQKKVGVKAAGLFCRQGPREFCFLSGETTMSIVVDESHKRILGEVPIEDDGSVHFEVPAMKAVYFQILDKDRKVLQTMRSSTHAMNGESRGCLGCHATKISNAPQTRPAKALRKPPQKLVKPFGDITFGFERYVQPILDKHCISCHNGSKDNKLDLRGTKFVDGAPFSTAYINLVYGVDLTPSKDRSVVNSIANPISCYYDYPSLETAKPEQETVVAPMTALSYNSKLIKTVESKHNGVELTQREIDILKAWIDLNCTFYGEEDVLDMPDIDENYFNNNPYPMFRGLAYPPKMKSCPDVDRAFRQDKFKTQADRLPKDKDGKILPAIRYEGTKRIVTPADK